MSHLSNRKPTEGMHVLLESSHQCILAIPMHDKIEYNFHVDHYEKRVLIEKSLQIDTGELESLDVKLDPELSQDSREKRTTQFNSVQLPSDCYTRNVTQKRTDDMLYLFFEKIPTFQQVQVMDVMQKSQ